MAALVKQVGRTRIRAALDWYVNHITDDYAPKAFSAKSFRDKFEQIEKAMLKDCDLLEIAPHNIDHAERLAKQASWPVEVMTKLPMIVQSTDIAWTKFINTVKLAMEELRKNNDASKKQTHLRWIMFLDQKVLAQHTFVEQWMEMIQIRLLNKKNYLGPIETLIFLPQREMFKDSFWHQWSAEWCGNPASFDDLLTFLTKGTT